MGEPRIVKKSKARILKSPVADSMPRLTPKVMEKSKKQRKGGDSER